MEGRRFVRSGLTGGFGPRCVPLNGARRPVSRRSHSLKPGSPREKCDSAIGDTPRGCDGPRRSPDPSIAWTSQGSAVGWPRWGSRGGQPAPADPGHGLLQGVLKPLSFSSPPRPLQGAAGHLAPPELKPLQVHLPDDSATQIPNATKDPASLTFFSHGFNIIL